MGIPICTTSGAKETDRVSLSHRRPDLIFPSYKGVLISGGPLSGTRSHKSRRGPSIVGIPVISGLTSTTLQGSITFGGLII